MKQDKDLVFLPECENEDDLLLTEEEIGGGLNMFIHRFHAGSCLWSILALNRRGPYKYG